MDGSAAAAVAGRWRWRGGGGNKSQPLLLGLLPRAVMHAVEEHRASLAAIESGAEAGEAGEQGREGAAGGGGLAGQHRGARPGARLPREELASAGGAAAGRGVGDQGEAAARQRARGALACSASSTPAAESDAFFQQRQQQQVGGNAGGSVPSSREAGAQFQTDLSGYADAYAQARLSDEELRGRLAFSSDGIGGAGGGAGSGSPGGAGFAEGSDLALLGKSRRELDALMPQRDLLTTHRTCRLSTRRRFRRSWRSWRGS